MAMQADEITGLLRESFQDAEIEIKDLAGDGEHYAVTITSSDFNDKTRVQQHQLVYQALKGHAGTTLHALALTTHCTKTG